MASREDQVTGPTVEIVDVTPQTAEEWLSHNPSNRNLRRRVIDAYARDMIAGHWVLNGETIKLASDARLLGGQHRLNAVVFAGVPARMIVVRNVDPEVMPTVDAGANRLYSDGLRLQGEESTATLAAVTRRTAMWTRGYRMNAGNMNPTPLEMNETLEANPRLRTTADVASKLSSRSLLPSSVVELCHWLFSDLDPNDASWFRLADGDGLASDDPIAVLRKWIIKMRTGGGRVHETDALALVIYAWNAHRAGETCVKLQMPRGPHAGELSRAAMTPSR